MTPQERYQKENVLNVMVGINKKVDPELYAYFLSITNRGQVARELIKRGLTANTEAGQQQTTDE